METDKLYIEPILIKITEKEAVKALSEAFEIKYKCKHSDETLAILYAKTCLETGRFKVGFHNYNFGNIKRQKDKTWTMFSCSEIINGKEVFFDPPHFQTHFSAFENLKEGALAYINFVSSKSRYKKAWQELLNGNPKAYCHELKIAGYYTANEEKYTNAVVSLFNEFLRRKDEFLISESTKNETSYINNNREAINQLAVDTLYNSIQ
jgi:flagellum-specific peptidoglycan hydrolase FlgJ